MPRVHITRRAAALGSASLKTASSMRSASTTGRARYHRRSGVAGNRLGVILNSVRVPHTVAGMHAHASLNATEPSEYITRQSLEDTAARLRQRTQPAASAAPAATHAETNADSAEGNGSPGLDFMGTLPHTRTLIDQEVDALASPVHAKAWINRVVDYTLNGGKMHRGMLVPRIVEQIGPEASARDGSLADLPMEQRMQQACTVGWAIEILQAAFLTIDDIMDNSVTRRGRPCYHTVVGSSAAINDGLILESLVFRILRAELKGKHPQYHDISELFRDIIFVTEVGQLLDATSFSEETSGACTPEDIEKKFTNAHYQEIVQFKTADYSFYLPVASALLLSGVTDEAILDKSRAICRRMGEYFQVQDDYLDCYGDPAVTGKVGTDIVEQKCSWLAVTALERLGQSPERAALLDAFVEPDIERRVRRVEATYETLGMQEVYAEYERTTREHIVDEVEQALAEAKASGAHLESHLYKAMLELVHGLIRRKK